MRRLHSILLCAAASLLLLVCCRKPDPSTPDPVTVTPSDGNYPPEIAAILIQQCATAGCHNDKSYENAGGLRLDTWAQLFEGASNGAVVIPYDTVNSSLLYFINRDPAQGLVSEPSMPLGKPALTALQYDTIRRWIAQGAPDKNGNIPFADRPETRQKIYLTEQGCDLVSVIDAEKGLVMRTIPVGHEPGIESPHCVRVSPDGRYAYVSFQNGSWLQQIDTRTDRVTGEMPLGPVVANGSWNVFQLTDDNRMMLSNWTSDGALVYINTGSLSLIDKYSGTGIFQFPHGIASSPRYDTFYIASNYGNTVYQFSPAAGDYRTVSINGRPAVQNPPVGPDKLDPHEIIMSPDHSRYFLSCEYSNEVRVMDRRTNTLLKVIPCGTKPQEFALSLSKPYLFVSCMEDSTLAGYKGSVYVIDYNTLEVVKVLRGKFYQPHGLAVDDQHHTLLVASTNLNPNGPAPHHASACNGRNGWYNLYDLQTLEPLNNTRYEVSVSPYSADVRFK